MKKIMAVLVSLLFIVSIFGIATTIAFCPTMKASTSSIAVGELVTIYSSGNNNTDPYTRGTAKVQKISGPTETYEEIDGFGYETKWVYKAYTPGIVDFSICSDFAGYASVSVTPKPHPMAFFMKLLGLGKKD